MRKADVFDDLIDLLIKKAVEDEKEQKTSQLKLSSQFVRGEKSNGIYSSAGIRKQA
ncbi:MAG: hypothetical protein N2376_06990 [Clostridia bacterium]|nr:hypothetical protein [Clostridia bacterium]